MYHGAVERVKQREAPRLTVRMPGMIEKLYLAKPRGFCAGVVMAIDAVKEAAEEAKQAGEGDIAVYHDIVHNRTVVDRLEDEHSVTFVERLDDLEQARRTAARQGRNLGSTVVFSAHGVSPVVRQRAAELGLTTIDATCPLVTKVHNEAKRYAQQGYHILLVGDSTQHQEVIGTRGEAPEQTTVVSVVGNRKHDPELADPLTVEVPDPDKVVVLTQTTLSVDDTSRIVAALKRRFPEIVGPRKDDICYATQNRQGAVKEMAPGSDVVIVVGSANSSNSVRLVEVALEYGARAAYRVDKADQVDLAWLEGARTVGLTSGASVPEILVRDVLQLLADQGYTEVQTITTAVENVAFSLPKNLRGDLKAAGRLEEAPRRVRRQA